MRQAILAAAAMTALAAGAAFASPLDDAKSGLAALDKGDNLQAIQLFTAAIDSHKLGRSDQELAYVKRAEAYLASHQEKSAFADANHALDLDPGDSEASAARDRAQALLTPPAAPPVQASGDKSDKADRDAAAASFEAEKKAAADLYAKQMADYDAQVKAENDRHAAELASWQDDVKACKAGVFSKCGGTPPAPPAVTQAAPVKPAPVKGVPPSAPKPQATASATSANPEKVAAKAPAKEIKKSTRPPEPDRPAIY